MSPASRSLAPRTCDWQPEPPRVWSRPYGGHLWTIPGRGNVSHSFGCLRIPEPDGHLENMLLAALAFGLVSGANDGGTLISVSAHGRGFSPLAAVGTLSLFVAAAPFIVGTSVAETLANRLVLFEARGGREAFLTAVVVALAVVLVLVHFGLPTSLTLALVGGIVGVGLGSGLPVAWGQLALVLLVGLAAPIVSAAAGLAGSRLLHLLPRRTWAGSRLEWIHHLTFTVQCLAYAANDAQKMVAIVLVAAGLDYQYLSTRLTDQALIGVCFGLGTLLSVQRTAARVGQRIMRVQSTHVLVSELSSSSVVLASSALGVPISTTQSVTAALVGSGVAHSFRRVRWQEAAPIGLAWIVTLPMASVLAGVVSVLSRSLH